MDRRMQVAAVRRLLEDGRSVLLVGPAGMGKSTVAGDVLRERPVAFGRARAGRQATAYAPLDAAAGEPLRGTAADVAVELGRLLDGRVLLAEDLHWADPATLAVLRTVAADRPVLMTSQRELDLPAVTVHLQPLSDKAATALVRRFRPGLPRERCRAVVAAGAGNPLHLATLACAEHDQTDLQSIVRDALESLDGPDRLAIEVLALAGAPGHVELPAATHALLEPLPDGRWWFSHDAVAAQVRALMTPDCRARALEALLDLAPAMDRPRLLLMLGHPGEAADEAEALLAHAPGTRRAGLLRVVCEGHGEDVCVDQLVAWSAALTDQSRYAAAEVVAGQALARARTPVDRGRATLAAARATFHRGDLGAAEQYCRDGMPGLEAAPLERTRVLVELASILARRRPEDPRTAEVVAEALACAEESRVDRPRALNAVGQVLSHTVTPGWEEHFVRAEQLAREEGDAEQECASAYWLASGYGFHGPFSQAPPLVDRMIARTQELDLPRWRHYFQAVRATHLLMLGWFTDADVSEAERLLAADPGFRNRAQVELVLATAYAERGEVDSGLEVVLQARKHARDEEDESLALAAAAELALAADDVDTMLRTVEDFVALDRCWFISGAFVELAATELWLARRAAGESLPELPRVPWPEMAGVAPVRSVRHALVVLDEEPHRSVDLLLGAATDFTRGRRPRLARRARLAAAHACLVAGEVDRARTLVATLVEQQESEGEDSAVRRAVELSRRLAADAMRQGLSPTQRQVMEGVARGLSSRQIAEELGRSVSTVETHVRTVLHRTGCANRAQAAGLLVGGNRSARRPVRLPSAVHDALVRDLVAGRSVASAAAASGLSRRTAHRRLAEACRAAGVATTAQLVALMS